MHILALMTRLSTLFSALMTRLSTLFSDVVAVYRRKSITALIEQQGGGHGGGDLLSSFFSGQFDPFANLAGDDFGDD